MLRENQQLFLNFLDTNSKPIINLYGIQEGKSWVGQYIKTHPIYSLSYYVYEWEEEDTVSEFFDSFLSLIWSSHKKFIFISQDPISSDQFHSQMVFYHLGA